MKGSSIQKFCASLLLVVFTVASTPKAFFHDLLADHRDGVGCTIHHKGEAVHQQTINCHFDDVVVNLPFLISQPPAELTVPAFTGTALSGHADHLLTRTFFGLSVRGPPAA